MIHNIPIIDPTPYVVAGEGKECIVYRDYDLMERLERHFGRPGLCLKVLKHGDLWGTLPMNEACKVQNVYHWYGMAPRVYGLVRVSGDRWGMVTDWAEGRGDPRKSKAVDIARKWRFTVQGGDIEKQVYEPHRWVGNQIVDFGRFRFSDRKWYERKLKQHVIRYHKKEHVEPIGYHPCPELDIGGRREIDSRVKQMGWDDVAWGDDDGAYSVLDIGCNTGRMSYEAMKRGAGRVCALDHKFRDGNRQLANWLGYWNIDFYEMTLPGDWSKIQGKTGLEQFDIVIALSIVGHAGGYTHWIPDLTRRVCFFSGQGTDTRETFEGKLKRDFDRVEWLGYVRDNGQHPLWRCSKEVPTDDAGDSDDGLAVVGADPDNVADSEA